MLHHITHIAGCQTFKKDKLILTEEPSKNGVTVVCDIYWNSTVESPERQVAQVTCLIATSACRGERELPPPYCGPARPQRPTAALVLP